MKLTAFKISYMRLANLATINANEYFLCIFMCRNPGSLSCPILSYGWIIKVKPWIDIWILSYWSNGCTNFLSGFWISYPNLPDVFWYPVEQHQQWDSLEYTPPDTVKRSITKIITLKSFFLENMHVIYTRRFVFFLP